MSRRTIKPNCLNCGEEVNRRPKIYCCKKCQNDYQYKIWIAKWLQGLENGITGNIFTSKHIHRYLREIYGDKCHKCGWHKIHPTTKKIPVQLEHKDGNYKNNRPENLELLCPNCHSLTLTFGGLNRGNGRQERINILRKAPVV